MHPRTAPSIDSLPEQIPLFATEFVQEERTAAASPRSRIKVLKKHLRRITTATIATELPAPEPPQAIEPVEIEAVMLHTEPVSSEPPQAIGPAEIEAVMLHTEPVPSEPPPSIEPVMPHTEPVPIVPEREKLAAVAIPPTKVEWDQPEDDIPSLDAVMEVLASEHIDELPIAPPEPKTTVTAPVRVQPAPAEVTPPAEIRVVTKIPQVTRIEPRPVLAAEPEEISAFRSRQIRIETEHPSPSPNFYDYNKFSARGSYEPGFIPTILGERKKREKVSLQPQPEQVLSAYNSPAAGPFRYRSILISGGFVALVSLFLLFGNNEVVRQYLQNLAPDDSVEAKAVPSKPAVSQPDKTNSAPRIKKTVVKAPDKIVPDDDPNVPDSKPAPSPKDRKSQSITAKSVVSQNAVKTPLIPSTRVIYSDNGEVKSKIVTDSRASDKNPSSAKDRSASPVRPRVVKAAPR